MRASVAVVAVVITVAGGCRDATTRREGAPAAPPPAPADAAVTPRAAVSPLASCAEPACAPFLLAKIPSERGTGIALDGRGFAYVATFFDDAIYRVALEPGATPALLYRSPGANLGDIEVHGHELRWSSNAAGRIYSAPTSGAGPVVVLADTLPGIWGFASDDAWIYWADFGGSAPGTIWKKPLRGGPSVALARHPASNLADHVLIDGEHLMYTDQSSRILRAPAAGGAAEVWLDLAGIRLTSGLAADATHLYLSTIDDRHVIRIDRATRAAEIIVTDVAGPARVAVDATHLYWVDYTPVEVWGRRK